MFGLVVVVFGGGCMCVEDVIDVSVGLLVFVEIG